RQCCVTVAPALVATLSVPPVLCSELAAAPAHASDLPLRSPEACRTACPDVLTFVTSVAAKWASCSAVWRRGGMFLLMVATSFPTASLTLASASNVTVGGSQTECATDSAWHPERHVASTVQLGGLT